MENNEKEKDESELRRESQILTLSKDDPVMARMLELQQKVIDSLNKKSNNGL